MSRIGGIFGVAVLAVAVGLAALTGCNLTGVDDSGGPDIRDYTSENIGTLVYVPAGSFQRDSGSSNISSISEPYRMSRHEITRQQFLDIMEADPSFADVSSGMSDPVQQVNWYHAIAFCNKLSIAEGLDTVYSVPGVTDWGGLSFGDIPDVNDGEDADWNAADADWGADGYRLPTEMEWMWAAMGADQDSQSGAMQDGVNVTGYDKAFAGDDGTAGTHIDDYAWYGEDVSAGSTHPTGEKTDYRGPASATNRITRGGGYFSSASECTVAYRYNTPPPDQHQGIGFRVVRP